MSGREDGRWQRVQDEAWSEYVYPRAAVGDLSDPNPQSAFMRAARVFRQWARRLSRDSVIAELETLADEIGAAATLAHEGAGKDDKAALVAVADLAIAARLRRRAAQLRVEGGEQG